ncbi:MAG: glycosyltransferase family 2 protein [Nitrospirota bacterium]|nr:glycosyltransferase family 2 protein [Nitrospirota bacterium]
MRKILIIIPAYNEEKCLTGVIEDLRSHYPAGDILVVDDGSNDGTASVARGAGARCISLPFNLGIGGAVQTGYRYAVAHEYDIAVQFDGDGQHVAADIEKLLIPLEQGLADIVVGSRFLTAGEYRPSFFRKIGISIFSRVLSSIIDIPMTDTTSGFRAANRRTIQFFSAVYPDDYPEVESLVQLHRASMRIQEVSVRMRDRSEGKSSITPVRSVYYMVKVLLAVIIDLMKKR